MIFAFINGTLSIGTIFKGQELTHSLCVRVFQVGLLVHGDDRGSDCFVESVN